MWTVVMTLAPSTAELWPAEGEGQDHPNLCPECGSRVPCLHERPVSGRHHPGGQRGQCEARACDNYRQFNHQLSKKQLRQVRHTPFTLHSSPFTPHHSHNPFPPKNPTGGHVCGWSDKTGEDEESRSAEGTCTLYLCTQSRPFLLTPPPPLLLLYHSTK